MFGIAEIKILKNVIITKAYKSQIYQRNCKDQTNINERGLRSESQIFLTDIQKSTFYSIKSKSYRPLEQPSENLNCI